MRMDYICTACLCTGRNLYYITTEPPSYEIYKQILYELSVYDPSELCLRVCWECRYYLHRFLKFKQQAQSSYKELLQAVKQGISSIPHIAKPPHLQIQVIETSEFPYWSKIKEEDVEILPLPEAEVKLEPKDLEEHHTEPETFVNNLDVKKTKTNTKERVKKKSKEKIKKVTKQKKAKEKIKKVAKQKKGKSKKVASIEDDLSVKSDEFGMNSDSINMENDILDIDDKPNIEARQGKEINVDEKEIVGAGSVTSVSLTDEEILKEREMELKSDQYVNSPFKCESCIIGFKSWVLLKSHTGQFHSESSGSHQCATCQSRFVSAALLAEHGAAHRRRYRCSCGRQHGQRDVMLRHAATHGQRRCQLCDHVSQSLAGHLAHLAARHQHKPRCAECDKVFSSAKTYRYHLNVLHKGHNKFPCPHCGKVYQWKSNLWRHIKNHKARDSDELHCAPCDKRFASVATYRQHLRVSRRHVAETDFSHVCAECGRKFVSKTKLVDHVAWEHRRKVKHRCLLCHKPFKSNTSLYVHLQNVHRSKDERDNLCHVCGKSYQSAAKLRYHIAALHGGETPYRCGQCAASFGWYSSLYRHAREVHAKIKVSKKPKRGKRLDTSPVEAELLPEPAAAAGLEASASLR